MKKRLKKAGCGMLISTLIALIIHYFLISRINVNSTFQFLIDFVIFWIIFVVIAKILGVLKKRRKKSKFRAYAVFALVIPVLFIHYFLISRINVNSTIQVMIDFMLFWFILGVLTQIKVIDDWMENKRE